MDLSKYCAVNCELFGNQAEYFESEIVPYWQSIYDSLVARASLTPGSRVLDVGTGTGETALRAAGAVGEKGNVVAIDLQDEMLRIARRKAIERRLDNVEFRRMPLEHLDLPDSVFDAAVGNYSLCCTLYYEACLEEIIRVLSPGGRLTYNHGGPSDSVASQVIFDIFEKYRPKKPSKRLREFRESDERQVKSIDKYRIPKNTLRVLSEIGYADPQAALVPRTITYRGPEDFVERMLSYDWKLEAEEMSQKDLLTFREEAVGELRELSSGQEFVVKDDMVFYTGVKGSR